LNGPLWTDLGTDATFTAAYRVDLGPFLHHGNRAFGADLLAGCAAGAERFLNLQHLRSPPLRKLAQPFEKIGKLLLHLLDLLFQRG